MSIKLLQKTSCDIQNRLITNNSLCLDKLRFIQMNQTHFHRRNLPHFYRPNSTYFITYRLKGTIPLKILAQLKEKHITNKTPKTKAEKYTNEKLFFAEYDKYLDNNKTIQYLKDNKVAEKVKFSLHYQDKKQYNLICYSVMPNHVHVVFHLLEEKDSIQTLPQTRLSVVQKTVPRTILSAKKTVDKSINNANADIDKLMKSIKGISAREANKILGKKGSFWQAESYDHIVRDEDELNRIVKYVNYNPVKAKLVDMWEDWEHTYLADEWW